MINSITTDVPSSLDIEWVINNYCNFNCSYCTPDLYGNTSRALDLPVAVEFFNTVHQQHPGIKMLSLSGGEPTLWKHLPEFVDSVASNYFFHIITNGSRTLDWWRKFMYNRRIDRITISLHVEQIDWDKTFANIEFLQNETDLTLLVLLKPGSKKILEQFVKRITDAKISASIKIKPLTSHDTRSVYNYNEDEKSWLQNFSYNKANINSYSGIAKRLIVDGKEHSMSYAYKLVAGGLNNFRGWNCNLGSSRMFIWHDGNVFPATCKTAMSKPIGNVFSNTLEVKTSSTKCADEFCHCAPDIRITKSRDV